MSLASPRLASFRFVSERLPRQPIKLAKWQAGSTRFEPKPKGNGMEYNGSVQDLYKTTYKRGFGFG